MTNFTAFLFVDVGTSVTHVGAWNPDSRQWVIPCNTIPRPTRDAITYSPTKRLCRSCDRLTRQTIDKADVPRTRNR